MLTECKINRRLLTYKYNYEEIYKRHLGTHTAPLNNVIIQGDTLNVTPEKVVPWE